MAHLRMQYPPSNVHYVTGEELGILDQGRLDFALYRPLRIFVDHFQVLSPLFLQGAFSKIRVSREVDFVHSLHCRSLSRFDVDYILEADQSMTDWLTRYEFVPRERLRLLRLVFKRIIDNPFFRGFIARSNKAKSRICSDLSLDPNRVEVVPVPMPVFRPRLSEDDVRILHVGTDFWRKGGDLVLMAFNKLEQRQGRKVHLTFVGPVPDSHQYLLEHPGIRNIPYVPREALMSEIMPECDIFVIPSRREAYGIGLLEAMSHGLAVIASTEYATAEIIESGVDGMLLRNLSLIEIVSALNELIDHESLRVELGRRARETIASRHNPTIVATQMRTVYDRLLSTAT